MTPTSYILGIAAAIVTLIVVVELLRRRARRERHGVGCLLPAPPALLVGISPDVLVGATAVAGVVLPTNLVFFVSIAILVLVCIQHSAELTDLEAETRVLAERAALLELRVTELERSTSQPVAGETAEG